MNRIEKFEMLIEKGYKYDYKTGNVLNPKGSIIKKKDKAGYILVGGIRIANKRIYVRAHQFAYYYHYKVDPSMIDHIDMNKANNKIENLRQTDAQLNQYNRICKGYRTNNIGKYIGQIVCNGKNIYLGSFNTSEEAHNAYLKAKSLYNKNY